MRDSITCACGYETGPAGLKFDGFCSSICRDLKGDAKATTGVGRCFQCKHWEGDRDRVAAQVDEDGLRAVSEEYGWVCDAGCRKVLNLGMIIDGDATVDIEFPSWYGCVTFEAAS